MGWRVVVAVLMGLAGGAVAEPLYEDGDYLAPELREQVEALKAEVARGVPTTLNNLDARLTVLWEWANALSEQGVNLPVELPRIVTQGRQIGYRRAYAMVTLPAVNYFVRELQIKEEQPGAIGTVTASVTGPWPVQSFVTFEQTYTVGEMPMKPGGSIMVAWELVARLSPYNREDPEAKNYITIRSSNSDAEWVETTHSVLGMHGNIFTSVGLPVYRLVGTTLEQGDTITITYGDRSGGGPGMELQTTEADGVLFPLYVDLEGNGNFMSPRWPEFSIVGGEAARVAVFAPSVLAPGEAFELAVRTEDYNYNRATSGIPSYRLTLQGADMKTVLSGGDGLREDEPMRFTAEGVYRFIAESQDGAIRGVSNPVWVTRDPAYRIYWGDTHAHTNLAEGQGTVANFFDYARNDARLDFVTLSEHDIWMDDGEWETLRESVHKYDDPGEFVTFLAYEWTAIVEAGGHHNVFFRTPDERARVPIQETDGLMDLFIGLEAEYDPSEVMLIPHAHIPGDWRLAHPDFEPLVEIASLHGTFEWFGNYYLRNGHQIGFIGATDDHSGRPGYTGGFSAGPLQQFGALAAVLAPEKTSGAIFDAMHDRLAYATLGQRTILDVKLNGSLMGQRLAYAPRRTIEGQVMGTAPIDTIDVVKNSDVVHTARYLDAPMADEGWLQVSFFSESDDLIRDAPRGHRTWKGSIEIENGTIEGTVSTSLGNYEKERVQADPNDPNRVEFTFVTRGRDDRLLLLVNDVSEETRLHLDVEPFPEEGVTFPRFYQASRAYPPVKLSFDFADLRDGREAREIPVGRYTDQVSLRWINPNGALDRSFEWTDPGEPADGDYYYVRVTQLDGRMAWSSPWWVGGIPVR